MVEIFQVIFRGIRGGGRGGKGRRGEGEVGKSGGENGEKWGRKTREAVEKSRAHNICAQKFCAREIGNPNAAAKYPGDRPYREGRGQGEGAAHQGACETFHKKHMRSTCEALHNPCVKLFTSSASLLSSGKFNKISCHKLLRIQHDDFSQSKLWRCGRCLRLAR